MRHDRSTLAAQGVQPQDPPGELAVGLVRGVVAEGAREEVDAEVDAEARVEQVLHLLVGLVAADLGRQVDGHQVGHRYVDQASDARDDDLRHQDTQPLAGARNLHT